MKFSTVALLASASVVSAASNGTEPITIIVTSNVTSTETITITSCSDNACGVVTLTTTFCPLTTIVSTPSEDITSTIQYTKTLTWIPTPTATISQFENAGNAVKLGGSVAALAGVAAFLL